jgi:hypothetical protein
MKAFLLERCHIWAWGGGGGGISRAISYPLTEVICQIKCEDSWAYYSFFSLFFPSRHTNGLLQEADPRSACAVVDLCHGCIIKYDLIRIKLLQPSIKQSALRKKGVSAYRHIYRKPKEIESLVDL